MMEKTGELSAEQSPCVHCGRPATTIIAGDPVCSGCTMTKSAAAGQNNIVNKAIAEHMETK